jgi:hypothetical protein
MPAFPLSHQTQGWDSKKFKVSSENPSITTPMEGGYTISRPRHTRPPRKTWRMGWECMKDTDYQTLKAFWDAPQRLLGELHVGRPLHHHDRRARGHHVHRALQGGLADQRGVRGRRRDPPVEYRLGARTTIRVAVSQC